MTLIWVIHRPTFWETLAPFFSCVFCGVDLHWVFAEWIYPGARVQMWSSSLMPFFRFGIGRFTTEEEVDYTVEKCIHHVKRLREMRYALCTRDPLEEMAVLTLFLSSGCVFTLPETSYWEWGSSGIYPSSFDELSQAFLGSGFSFPGSSCIPYISTACLVFLGSRFLLGLTFWYSGTLKGHFYWTMLQSLHLLICVASAPSPYSFWPFQTEFSLVSLALS